MKKRATAVLLSGGGSNFHALAEHARTTDDFPADIRLVISNVPGALGLERARSLGIGTLTIDHRTFSSREAFDSAMQRALDSCEIEFICLAGFMRILGSAFVRRWSGRMLNIHPSLLPAFRGNRAIEQVLASPVTITGCTVHVVTEALDEGPIVGQAVIAREAGDRLDQLSARVHRAEHVLYPAAVRSFLGASVSPTILELPRGLIHLNPTVRYSPAAGTSS